MSKIIKSITANYSNNSIVGAHTVSIALDGIIDMLYD